MILDRIKAGTVGVVFGVGAIGDHKDLYILKQTAACPEGIPLVAVDLVEGFPDGHTAPLEFDMHQRQSVDQNRHVITIVVPGTLIFTNHILIDHL